MVESFNLLNMLNMTPPYTLKANKMVNNALGPKKCAAPCSAFGLLETTHGRYNTHFIRFIIKLLTTVKRHPRPLFCDGQRRRRTEELSILGS